MLSHVTINCEVIIYQLFVQVLKRKHNQIFITNEENFQCQFQSQSQSHSHIKMCYQALISIDKDTY